MQRRGILTLPPELLFGILGIKDATLLDAKVNHFGAGSLDMVIESPAMPEYREGEHPRSMSLEEMKNAIVNRQPEEELRNALFNRQSA